MEVSQAQVDVPEYIVSVDAFPSESMTVTVLLVSGLSILDQADVPAMAARITEGRPKPK